MSTLSLEKSKGRQRQLLPSSLGVLDQKHRFPLRQTKGDNISAVKMLHQRSIRVVVVALGLVLTLSLSLSQQCLHFRQLAPSFAERFNNRKVTKIKWRNTSRDHRKLASGQLAHSAVDSLANISKILLGLSLRTDMKFSLLRLG